MLSNFGTYLSGGDASASTVTSGWMSMQDAIKAVVFAYGEGDFVGTVQLEGAVSESLETLTSALAVLIAGTAAPLTGTEGDFACWEIHEMPYSFIRVKYTKTSGSGSLTVQGSKKVESV